MRGPPMYFYMFCALSSSSFLVSSHLSYSMCLFTSRRTCFLCLASAREPTSIHSLPQWRDVPCHQPVWALFSLSFYLSFVLLTASSHLLIIFSSTVGIPWVLVLLATILVLQALLFSLPMVCCLCPLLPFASIVKVVYMKVESAFSLQLCSPFIMSKISSFPNPILSFYLLPLLLVLLPW